MDVSIQGMDNPTLSDSLRRALRLVSRKSPEALFVLNEPEDIGDRLSRSAEQTGLYQGGLHVHACVEVCFCIEGTCRIWTPDGFVVMESEKMVAIPPNTIHCEGWERRQLGYRALWLVLIGDSCSAFSNLYAPAHGWQVEGSVSIQDSSAECIGRALQGVCSVTLDHDAASLYLLQGGLLTVLADLLQRGVDIGRGTREDRQRDLVAQLRQYIIRHYSEPLSVASLSALFRLSPNYLNMLFSRQEGMGIHAYLLRQRLQVANTLLRKKELLVKEVAYQVGFSDPLYFSRLYKQRFGHPPSATSGQC